MKTARRAELTDFWRNLGVRAGAPLLCHSFLVSLGKPAVSPAHDLLGSLLDALGPEGTLFAPTFTYSYFNDEVYDRQKSASMVGVLGDLVRTHPGAVRSLDPNFSNAGIGPHAEAFLARTTKLSFGPETFYNRLVEADAQILLIGVDFTALPLFMQIERMNQVPYRYEKRFTGITRDGGREFEDEAIHFVRALELDFVNDRTRVGAEIEADAACCVARYVYGIHRLTTAKMVVRVAEVCLERNPHALICFQSEAGRKAAADL
ncbi:MAG: AAC(3) family N-acetyltransferase [Gemmatimonadetes bacterium]|nr:AAC(3) family N-acetyltransferase [Gemmatimonadota bacterium]